MELKRSLYTQNQASLNWFKMLKTGLKLRGYQSSDVDPCVFLSKEAIILTYVDDCLVLAKSDAVIDCLVQSLKQGEEKFYFTDNGDIKYYLGVEFSRYNDSAITLKQEFLIERIISALGIRTTDIMSKPTPATKPNLVKDKDGPMRKYDWHYCLLIGMLNYLEKTSS